MLFRSNGTPTEVAFDASVSPKTGISTANISVEMNDPAKTINVTATSTVVRSADDTKWINNDASYTFGAFTTAEPNASIDIKFTNDFGIVRTYTMTYQIKN